MSANDFYSYVLIVPLWLSNNVLDLLLFVLGVFASRLERQFLPVWVYAESHSERSHSIRSSRYFYFLR